MKIRRVSICCRALFVAFLSTIYAADVSAQFISGGHSGLSASGSTEVAIVPTRLRLELQIQAEGRDAKTALKALADHKKAVQEGLIAMKAEADSIEFSGAQLSEAIAGAAEGDSTPYGVAMQRAIMMRGGLPAQAEDDSEPTGPPKIFRAKATVTADWKLPTKDLDALALLPETLKAQIAQRDLQGKKIKAELTEEEKEALSDYQRQVAQQGAYYSGQQPTPEVRVWFVGRLEGDQEKAALKQAYESAVANARLLAEAAGQKLGKIQVITQNDSMVDESQYVTYAYDQFGNQQNRRRTKRGDGEVLSVSASDLQKKVTVYVVFGLE